MAVTSYITPLAGSAKRPPLGSQRAECSPTRKVAILGFGTVGRAVGEILSRKVPGLRLTLVFNRNVERKQASFVANTFQWTAHFAEVLASDADIVVELIGGVEPAVDFIRQALRAGKSVVTANKHVMANYGLELLALAQQHGQRLEYGASVGGVVPVLPALHYGLAGDRLFRLRGVLNGTCNYILSSMEEGGATLRSALAKAQNLGYAEADPADDVNGLDAACKLAIVARVGLAAELNPLDVARQSIAGIEPVDFHYANKLGCTIRQLSYAEVKDNRMVAAVGPALVPLSSPLANTRANQNAVIVTGHDSGDTLLQGQGAGGAPTAVAVVSDLLAISREGAGPQKTPTLHHYPEVDDLSAQHYLRVAITKNKQAELMERLRKHGILVHTRLAEGSRKKSEIVVLTRKCASSALHKAFEQILPGGRAKTPMILPVLR